MNGAIDGWGEQASVAQSWRTSTIDVARYAGAAQDFNPIHLDDGAAQAIGFDRAVAHGMFTLGRALSGLVDQAGPRAIRSIRARFSAPLEVGDTARASWSGPISDRPELTVEDSSGRTVLTCTVGLSSHDDGPDPGGLLGDRGVERRLVVERGAATRFAASVATQSDIYYREDAARAAGYVSIPVVPTFLFALPNVGFFPDFPGNEGAAAPDAVRDCQDWAATDRAVAHATQEFLFTRPLVVGESVVARTGAIGRSSKTSRSGRALHFTQVRSLITDLEGRHVATSDMGLVVMGD